MFYIFVCTQSVYRRSPKINYLQEVPIVSISPSKADLLLAINILSRSLGKYKSLAEFKPIGDATVLHVPPITASAAS